MRYISSSAVSAWPSFMQIQINYLNEGRRFLSAQRRVERRPAACHVGELNLEGVRRRGRRRRGRLQLPSGSRQQAPLPHS